jgi:hypothetical protein
VSTRKGPKVEAEGALGRTVLFNAALHGHGAVVRPPVEKGADPAAKDRSDKTPWSHAEESGYGDTPDFC